jgi:hypothetical protein
MRASFGVNTEMRVSLFATTRVALMATTFLLLTLLSCDAVLACNCLPLSPNESLRNADVVFEGRLLGITRLPSSSHFSLAYTFDVRKSVKGSAGTVVSVFGEGNECDAYFEPGFIYRVYASNEDGTFTSGTCAGNQIIGTFVSRSFSHVPPPPYWPRFLLSMVEICGLGVLLGSGVFVWRRCVTKLP